MTSHNTELKPWLSHLEVTRNVAEIVRTRRIAVAAIVAALALALLAASAAAAATDGLEIVDYRHYALDSWIGAIGLPDDAYKCVVDADGRFMTELGKSKGRQGVYPNAPAQTQVVIHADLLGGTARVTSGWFRLACRLSSPTNAKATSPLRNTSSWPGRWIGAPT